MRGKNEIYINCFTCKVQYYRDIANSLHYLSENLYILDTLSLLNDLIRKNRYFLPKDFYEEYFNIQKLRKEKYNELLNKSSQVWSK